MQKHIKSRKQTAPKKEGFSSSFIQKFMEELQANQINRSQK